MSIDFVRLVFANGARFSRARVRVDEDSATAQAFSAGFNGCHIVVLNWRWSRQTRLGSLAAQLIVQFLFDSHP